MGLEINPHTELYGGVSYIKDSVSYTYILIAWEMLTQISMEE